MSTLFPHNGPHLNGIEFSDMVAEYHIQEWTRSGQEVEKLKKTEN